MADANPSGDAVTPQLATRKRAFQIGLAVLLLLPIPSLAGTLAIGPWNYIVYSGNNPGAPWTTSSSGNSLTFQGSSGNIGTGQDTIIVMYAQLLKPATTATTISAVTSNFQTLTTTKGSVAVSIAFADQSVNTITYIYGPNMFSGKLPPTLGAITNKPIPATAFYIAVAFDFSGASGGTTWTTQASSPFQVNFSGF